MQEPAIETTDPRSSPTEPADGADETVLYLDRETTEMIYPIGIRLTDF